MSLLEKAKKIQLKKTRRRSGYTDEEIELAVAWLKDEIRTGQASQVLTTTKQNILATFSTLLKLAYKKGLIK